MLGKLGDHGRYQVKAFFYSDNNHDNVDNDGGDGGDEEDLGHLVTWPVPGNSISSCKEGS